MEYQSPKLNDQQILLNTSRLILRIPTDSDSPGLKAFEERNIHHLSPWISTSPEIKLDHCVQITKWKEEFAENRAIRFLIFLREAPEKEIIGFCNFSQIFRGPFQACYLGYQIDSVHEGKGLMSEATKCAIEYMFEKQNLHRIMANYMPSNIKSAKLLRNLGFIVEGEAKNYLLINNKWEDHVLASLTNQKWISF